MDYNLLHSICAKPRLQMIDLMDLSGFILLFCTKIFIPSIFPFLQYTVPTGWQGANKQSWVLFAHNEDSTFLLKNQKYTENPLETVTT